MLKTQYRFTVESRWPEGGWSVTREVVLPGKRSPVLLDVWQGADAMPDGAQDAVAHAVATMHQAIVEACGAGQGSWFIPDPY